MLEVSVLRDSKCLSFVGNLSGKVLASAIAYLQVICVFWQYVRWNVVGNNAVILNYGKNEPLTGV